MSATSKFVEFACDLTLTAVPDPVQHQARRTLLNYFGCAFGGVAHDSVEALLHARSPWAGPDAATIIGRSQRTDPLLAAQANGIASAVYSFDDTHAEALVHPGGPVASALLPVAEVTTASGADVLRAFVIGAELVCRLSKGASVAPAQARTEWVQTGICGGPGAALAAALLLQLPARQIVSAIGLAACRSAGYRGLTRSMCFSYMAGSAAEAGLGAAMLAQAGMTGPDEPLTGPNNFGVAFSREMNEGVLTTGLGTQYELLANTYKPYPCGVVIHPVIDACLSLAPRLAEDEDANEVEVTVNPAVVSLANIPEPADQFEGQMSLQHWTACALSLRRAGVEQTKPDALSNPAVARMRQRVSLKQDQTLARGAARVRIVTNAGRVLEGSVEGSRGSADRPMTDADLEEKFSAQARPVIGAAQARELAQACWHIEQYRNVADLLRTARPN
jgi:2-methylcitrate dehydratase PrpD